MNPQLVNVLLLGLAFHLIFFSFQTSVFIQQTVVNSIKNKPEYNFHGDGYISLCITYTVFALSNWMAPSMIALTGVKYAMFLGAITYALYSASFIYPTTALFYAAAGLIGLGAGPLWSAQGSYLAKNSDNETTGRNAALFWSMLQSSILLGNIFVYLAFESQVIISDKTRYMVYGVLTAVCSLGALVILFLKDQSRTVQICDSDISAWGQFVGALKLAKTGVYGTAIGATIQFGLDAKKYIGLSGVFIGIGEILGGSIFGLMGAKLSKGLNRDKIFILGFIVTMTSFALIYVNLPPDSSLVERAKMPTIIEPRIWVAMLSSALIGFGDACFNTQVYSLLMSHYSSNSVASFALFKFVQSSGSAVAFLYSTTLNLHHQIFLLAVIATMATVSFCVVEWNHRTRSVEIGKSESQSSIINHHQDDQFKKNYHSTSRIGKVDKKSSIVDDDNNGLRMG